jgi:hypothetical protein
MISCCCAEAASLSPPPLPSPGEPPSRGCYSGARASAAPPPLHHRRKRPTLPGCCQSMMAAVKPAAEPAATDALGTSSLVMLKESHYVKIPALGELDVDLVLPPTPPSLTFYYEFVTTAKQGRAWTGQRKIVGNLGFVCVLQIDAPKKTVVLVPKELSPCHLSKQSAELELPPLPGGGILKATFSNVHSTLTSKDLAYKLRITRTKIPEQVPPLSSRSHELHAEPEPEISSADAAVEPEPNMPSDDADDTDIDDSTVHRSNPASPTRFPCCASPRRKAKPTVRRPVDSRQTRNQTSACVEAHETAATNVTKLHQLQDEVTVNLTTGLVRLKFLLF